MNIEDWLVEFRDAWSSHDIGGVVALFDEDVEYWENPHKRLGSREDLRNEWQAVMSQKNIKITTSVYASAGNKHSVIWNLNYLNDNKVEQHWSGVYLITLNDHGVCEYFYHVGEKS